ncbi:hypothetical protein O181_036559 [Austropuccinia psidii MF-1]|uniref:Uncharacterized protein n=1 Tax=Austropuccinia psidii MF-1 TaxID=1389203 RepID=A0A9Q3D4W7_9BASI|nr:hypothetical protein [Austropuccinia psidii MF-1]
MKLLFSSIRWIWTRKKKEQFQIWQAFLKKGTFGGFRSCLPLPRSVPLTFDINSEPELIQANVLRVEPLPSGRYRNISVLVQDLVQRSQGRGVGNLSKPLEGGHQLLLTNQEPSGSGVDHRALRRTESLVLQWQGQKDKRLVEEPKYFIHGKDKRVGNYPKFGEERPSGVHQL